MVKLRDGWLSRGMVAKCLNRGMVAKWLNRGMGG